MKRIFLLSLLSILTACATGPNTPPASTAQIPCPKDASEAWMLYRKAAGGPATANIEQYRECAAMAGHTGAMSSLGSSLAIDPRKSGDIERGVALLKRAAAAGERAAQQYLSFVYETGRTETGKAWAGRNAYLALFWHEVRGRNDPSYRFHHSANPFLDRYRNQLSEQARRTLSREIKEWRRGQSEPPNYTFDILITSVIARNAESTAKSEWKKITENALNYGIASNLPDAGLLALFQALNRGPGQQPMQLVDEFANKGSLLALMIKGSLNKQNGEDAHILQLLSRMGLDVRHLRPLHLKLVRAFAESGDIDPLLHSIDRFSLPEQQILATTAAMVGCGKEPQGFCRSTVQKLRPFVTSVALSFFDFLNAMAECDIPSKRLSCMSGNGGNAALRDIIVNDLVDFGGRSV